MTAPVDPPEPAAGTRSHGRDAAWIAAAAVVVLLFVGVAERIAYRGRVMSGVKIGTLDVGSEHELPAYASIKQFARRLDTDPIRAVTKGHQLVADPDALHVQVDARATIRKAREAGRSGNPFEQVLGTVLRRFRPDHVAPVMTYDDRAVDAVIDHWSAQVDQGVQEGGLRFSGTKITEIPPKAGVGIDRDQARAALVSDILDGSRTPLRLGYGPIAARTTQAQVTALAARARTILGHGLEVRASNHTFTATPTQVAAALTTHVVGDQLALAVNRSRLEAALRPQLDTIGVAPVDARFVVNAENRVDVVPSHDGLEPDLAVIGRAIVANRTTVAAGLARRHPEHDTAWAQRLGITEQVSTFTTHYIPGQARVTNIHRAADILNNTVVAPGQVFSLNDTVGARTPERGFVKAPVYYDGEAEDFGGGVSQIATTTYNAAFWGGFKIIFHKPHSVYYSRYPLGREATVNYPVLDLKWQNNSHHGVLVRASYTDSSVTITFYGNREGKTVTEESTNCASTSPTQRCVDILKTTPIVTTVVACPVKNTSLDPANDCATLAPGEMHDTVSGHTGYLTLLYRVIDQPGHPQIRDRISWQYHMTHDIVLIGAPAPGGTTTTGPGHPGSTTSTLAPTTTIP